MKIIELQAENVKKLVAVEIKPDGNIVEITGKNGQGKTSVLDSIWWALAGAGNIQSQPIRKGETAARIRLDLGELKVERRFTEKGGALIVENADGARFPSPQRMLDALIGELSFDPLAFARMEAKKQVDELRRVSKLEVDCDALDGLNRRDYENRTEVNRQAKAKRAQADGIFVPDDLPAEPVDEKALLDQMQKAADHNADIETRKTRRTEASSQIAAFTASAKNKRDRAADLREQADTLDAEAAEAEGKAMDLEEKLAKAETLPDPISVADLRAKLDAAQETNTMITQREQQKKLIVEAEALEAQSEELTQVMAAREQQKREAIAAAKMPVEGLGFGDGAVTFNGIPLDQCSSAEQLRISLAIAMASNPKLRVIRIQDGSLLDEDSLAQIGELAASNDYQVWIERVDSSGKVGFIIEDGHARRAGEPLPDPAMTTDARPTAAKPKGGKKAAAQPAMI